MLIKQAKDELKQILLREGTLIQKRELLGCHQSKLVLEEKKITHE